MQPIPEQNFFYSNLFVALITLIAGSFVIYLYYRRRKDNKRSLAKIILLEIENAQEKVKEAKKQFSKDPDGALPEHLYTMPTDSWTANKHQFVNNFDPTEWAAINDFYDTCQLYDEAIRHNDSRFAEQEREVRQTVFKASYKYTLECSEALLGVTDEKQKKKIIDEFFEKRNAAVDMLTDGGYIRIYTPMKHNQIVKSCLETVETSLSMGSVGQTLKKLSGDKKDSKN